MGTGGAVGIPGCEPEARGIWGSTKAHPPNSLGALTLWGVAHGQEHGGGTWCTWAEGVPEGQHRPIGEVEDNSWEKTGQVGRAGQRAGQTELRDVMGEAWQGPESG